MRKKTVAYILTLALMISCAGGLLASCASYTDGAATTGYAFVKRISEKDYAGAYDYIYSFSQDVKSKQNFIDRFTNIYEALGIGAVSLVDTSVTEKEGEDRKYTLSYTLNLNSSLLGVLTYTFEADIISGPLGFAVIYSPSLVLPMLEEGDKVRVMNESGTRGEIFSSDGKILAKNDYAQSIYIDLDKNPNIDEACSYLAQKYGADTAKLKEKCAVAAEKGYPLQALMTFPRDTLASDEIESISAVNGLGVDDQRLSPVRYYPLADNAAHLVGYMGAPREEQIKADPALENALTSGQSGIEAAFEKTLRGTDGRIIYIEDDRGEMKEILYEDPKFDGSDVYLTIDSTTQNAAYTLLATNCKEAQSGAVIVMDYTNGDVKAMVSYPSFDTNLFSFPIDTKVWDYYISEEAQKPLFSRTTQALYMPGSSFKPFSTVPAIESGILDPYYEPPIDIENDRWTPNVKGWQYDYIGRVQGINGPFDFEHSMKSSDNIYFAYYAMKVPLDTFKSYMEQIGIGEAPAFELPVTKSSLMTEGSEWNLGLQARTGYGMGELHITPLQLAAMYTALVNEGDILNPTVVDKISRTDGNNETVEWENQRTIFKERIMKQDTIDMEMQALRRVITDGTAYYANLQGISTLYAKTGTAQIGTDKSREVNWVVAIDKNPDKHLIYLVVVDTKTNEGTQPKLAILRGLVDSSNYNSSLMSDLGSVAYSEQSPNGSASGGDQVDQGDGDNSGSSDSGGNSNNNGDGGDDSGDTGGGDGGGDGGDTGGGGDGDGGDTPVVQAEIDVE